MENNTALKPRLHWIDVLKGVGIILIMMGHINSRTKSVPWIYSVPVALFFALSGFIFSTFEIKKNRDDVISILVKYYKYSGGAHGYYEYIPYNIDLRKGNFIALKDIFKDNVDYKMLINKEIENQIKEMRKNEKYIDKIYEFHGIKENQKFYLQDGKIVIFFDLYDIAPYAAGVPEFPITSKNIENQIELEYMTLIK